MVVFSVAWFSNLKQLCILSMGKLVNRLRIMEAQVFYCKKREWQIWIIKNKNEPCNVVVELAQNEFLAYRRGEIEKLTERKREEEEADSRGQEGKIQDMPGLTSYARVTRQTEVLRIRRNLGSRLDYVGWLVWDNCFWIWKDQVGIWTK